MCRLVAIILLLGFMQGCSVITAMDFDAGMDAYHRGDHETALRKFQSLAEQGDADAQNNLGVMYANGEGVAEDDRQAVYWYRKAAEQGFAAAQNNLGIMYANGEGVAEDDRQAVYWYRKAAEQGNARAQYNLGVMYANGEGVAEDYVRSYVWVNLAAAQGFEEAKQFRPLLRELMTSEQIAEAQQISRELDVRIAANVAQQKDRSKSKVKGNGSGFVVSDDGDIVTNHHVVEDCAQVTVSHAGLPRDAVVQATDDADDLALLKVPQTTGEAAMFSRSSRACLGEAVTVAGYPLQGLLSEELNVTNGNISAMAGPGGDARLLQITAPIQPGNSGGPLLDGAGNVIGVVVSKLDAVRVAEVTGDIPQNVNFAIKGALVRGFLDIHGIAYQRQVSNKKLAPTQLAESAHNFTVAVHCWE